MEEEARQNAIVRQTDIQNSLISDVESDIALIYLGECKGTISQRFTGRGLYGIINCSIYGLSSFINLYVRSCQCLKTRH